MSVDETSSWTILIKSIKEALKTKEVNKPEVRKILSAYKSDEKDWMEYVFFNEQFYTRNLVDAGNGIYNIMIMAWNPAQGSCIHNHANSSCFVKMLAGSLREIKYEMPEENEPFRIISNSVVERDSVTYMDDSIGVHEMKNDGSNQAVSLHLYIPPFEVCHKYNRKTAVVTLCSMKFTSVYGVLDEEAVKQSEEASGLQPCC